MKNLILFAITCLVFFAPANELPAQTVTAGHPEIELTTDELKAMIRKMAELRRQRVVMWQQQQMIRQRAAIAQRSAEALPTPPQDVTQKNDRVAVDTVIKTVEANRLPGQTVTITDNSAELADLRRRLDRQEELLLSIRDRSLTAANPPPPARSDTIVRRIILNQQKNEGANLSKEDLQMLTNEVSRMNTELNSLRRRLAAEEDRRRLAELETERILRNNGNNRSESWESERLRYERDQNRARREEERNRTVTPVAPVIIEKEAPVRVIRDTVYVDRVSTTPVFIPTAGRTDTVIVIKETIRAAEPTIVKDTVIVEREREVVRTDTLQLKSIEPISFPSIFFDNNSSQLNAAHRSIIAGAVNLLSDKTNYTVRLTGFASPSGNAAYNQQLSAKRAAAVRQGFENAGLDGNRVVIVPGGIDFKPANAAAARRVEVEALPN